MLIRFIVRELLLSIVAVMFIGNLFSPFCFAEDPSEGHLPVFLSSNSGMTGLTLDASPFTGEATSSLAIKVLPSVGNIQEKIKLALTYRSGGGNSWVGKGRDLELGYIAKINKFGANNANNPYFLLLNGQSYELVSIGSDQYRTKIESYLRIQYNGSSWKVWEKDGTLYKFEVYAAGKWLLTRITDVRGFSIAVDYDIPTNEEAYLKEIRYPEYPDLTPYCKIKFISEDRQDKTLSYYFGNCWRINKRLKEVQILADNIIQKKYVLGYTTDGTTQVSFLSSMTEYGKDGSVLPPTNFYYQPPLRNDLFGYKGYLLPDLLKSTYFNSSDGSIGPVPAGFNSAIIDLNGDNLPDLIWNRFQSSSTALQSDWVVNLNTGNGFSSQGATWLSAQDSFSSLYFGYARTTYYQVISLGQNATLIDMNNDRLPDLVYSKLADIVSIGSVHFTVYDIMVRYNTGNGFSGESKIIDHSELYYITDLGSSRKRFEKMTIGDNVILADMNGDGLPDLVYNRNPQSYNACSWYVRLNTGSGFSPDEKIWLNYDKAYFIYSLYNGCGYENRGEFINVTHNSMLIDMNNDGLLDLVFNDLAQTSHDSRFVGCLGGVSYNWKVRYNTGNAFSDEAITYYSNAPVYFYWDINQARVSSVRIGENGTLADVNNDGLPDLVFNKCQQDKLGYKPDISWMVCFNLGNSFGEPVKLFDSLCYSMASNGKFAKVLTYNSYFTDINKDGILDFIFPEFTEFITPNQGKFNLKIYSNKGSVGTDLLSRQISSFGGKTDMHYASSGNFSSNFPFITPVIESVKKDAGISEAGTTSYYYEDGKYDMPKREFRGFRHVQTTDPLRYVNHTYFHQGDSKLGKVDRQENSVIRIFNTYKDDDTAPFFTPLIQTDEYTDSKCRRTNYDYDDYGNVIKETYYGDTDVTGDEKTVLADYAINPSLWLVNLIGRERVFGNADSSGAALSETLYYYDDHSKYTDEPVKGELTKANRYLDTKNNYVEVSSTYDTYGNEISKTDANGKITNIAYDSTYHAFPITVTNPKGHIEKINYYLPSDTNGLFGQIKLKIDANNNETKFEYDGFGRKTKIIGPYDTGSTYGSESYEYGINGPGANYIIIRTTEESGTANHLIKTDILDGFERMIRAGRESENEGIYAYTDTFYNPRGETAKISLPYFQDGGLKTNYQAVDENLLKWTSYAYDLLGRITQITKPDSSAIKNTYSGWTTNITDENGHIKTIVNDAYERLAGVIENDNQQKYTTNYQYDALDNLKIITDHLGNQTQFFYDSLKRKIKMQDPDLGAWTYDYDNNGNLIKSTNAKAEVINYTYDELNRMIGKDYPGGVGIEVTYNYDEAASTNGIGRRTSMNDLSGRSLWDYDKKGRIVKLEKAVDDKTHKIEWAYDAMDRVKNITLPNEKEINFSYNKAGLINNIDGYITGVNYNAANQPVEVRFSNPITTRFDYYPETLRLKTILSGSLQDLNYEYDLVGNVAKITDRVYSSLKDYVYDDLDRLMSGDDNSYEYDAIGNIIKINGITRQYSSARPHALTGDGINAYVYDSCGNMISGAGRVINYDPESRPISITKGGITTQFVYDGDGKRVKKTVTDRAMVTSTVYVDNLYEIETTQFR